MHKILGFSALLLASSFTSLAQTAPPPAKAAAVQYEHCILIATASDYARPQLDYGQTMKEDTKNEAMAETDRMVRKLGTAVAALNYLSSQGWECIGFSGVSGTSYLLRRAR